MPHDLAGLPLQFCIFEIPRNFTGSVNALVTRAIRSGVKALLVGDAIDLKAVLDQLREVLQENRFFIKWLENFQFKKYAIIYLSTICSFKFCNNVP